MKATPISMQIDFIPALLARLQTVTHRIMKPQPDDEVMAAWITKQCPYGRPGDYLYVLQKWRPTDNGYEVWTPTSKAENWNPARSMPKEAAQIWLQITEVNGYRLSEVTPETAAAEGMERTIRNNWNDYLYKNYLDKKRPVLDPLMSFKSFMTAFYGATILQENPWFYAIHFSKNRRPKL